MTRPVVNGPGGDNGWDGESPAQAGRVALGLLVGALALLPCGYGFLLVLAGPWATGGGIMAMGAGLGVVALACAGARWEQAPAVLFVAVLLILLGLLVCAWGPEAGRLVVG